MVEGLNRASHHLINALNGKELSGAAYTAGKGMFSQLVIPTISKASEALEKLKSETKKYEDFASSAGDELLDEDKLNEKLQSLQAQQAALSSQIDFFKQQAMSHKENSGLSTSFTNYSNTLSSYMSTVSEDIQEVQKKLKKLHEFNSNVNPLFKNSIDEFKTISMIALAITGAEFDKFGKFINSQKFVQIIQDIHEKSGDSWYKDLGKEEIKELLSQGTVSGTLNEIGHDYKIRGYRSSLNTRGGRGLFSKGEDLMEMGENIGNCKWMKVGGGVFSALSIGLDYNDQMSQYNDVGRAVKNTTAHTVIGMGGAAAGSYIGGAIGSVIPGAAIGAGIGWAGNKVYDWVESGEGAKFIDKTSKHVSSTVDSIKNSAQEIFGNWGRSLGGAFG